MSDSSDSIPDVALAPVTSSSDVIPHAALAGYDLSAGYDLGSPEGRRQYFADQADQESEADVGAAEGVLHAVTGGFSNLVGGFRYAMGADKKPNLSALTYEPRTTQGKAAADLIDTAGGYLGAKEGEAAGSYVAEKTGSPLLGATVNTLLNVPQLAAPYVVKGLMKGGEGAPAAVAGAGASEAPSAGRVPALAPEFDSPPIEGGLPATAQGDRAQVLARVGLQNARESALSGNAKDAATDYQLSRFDEPTGVEAKNQFNAERAALQAHGERIVANTGGTLGTDEDTLATRGQTIARPFEQLEDWFDTQRKALYGAADQRANGGPVTHLESVDALLNEPRFKNTLLAKDQGGLLASIQSQLGEFREQSPQGFSVAGAEQFRQFLNEIWTNDNKGVIGRVKGAVDQDVLNGAGEDIYGPARALQQMRHQTLDNPSGVSRLMDRDPQTPINRTTPFVKIPDTLTRLDPDQFANVIKTLDVMPEEIQPAAQAAKAEIKAHLASKLVDAGSSTQGQWNAPAVSKVLKANSAKLQIAFADQPEVLAQIKDLDSAGKILKVDQSYPGAAAQAANALKRGMMSRLVSKGAAATGALAGSAVGGVLGVPTLGAAAGAGVGENIGSSLSQGMGERAALKRWNDQLVPLSELLKEGPPKR